MRTHGSDDESCESLANTIQERMHRLPQYSAKRCIYRVPNTLRKTNEQAYTPSLVSIGPLHHNDARFLPMEAHKLKYLQSFLRESKMNVGLNYYLRIIKGMEAEIRECYADPIHLSSNDFTQMVLIDSVFIIELFRRFYERNFESEDDYMYGCPHLIHDVRRDITLAENQLPFFILRSLYWTSFKPHAYSSSVPSFTKIACESLEIDESKINVDATDEASCLHLLDLLLLHYKPPSSMVRVGDDCISIDIYKSSVCPTATSLHEAGVKFKVVSSEVGHSSNLLDIHFDASKGILTIPKLEVMDRTEHLFRNLIAFEQCHRSVEKTYMTDYQGFLNWLINTSEDVHLLVKAGILENWLGSDNEAADLFNSLGQNVSLSMGDYIYLETAQQLITHCDKRWNRYRATLRHTYFKHPWAAISVIYAVILLILTLIQVFTGIMALP